MTFTFEVLVIAAKPPNISETALRCLNLSSSLFLVVVMLADDLGWNDVSWHNPEMVTPNLERMADMGTVLNSSYFHPKCSPSRWVKNFKDSFGL